MTSPFVAEALSQLKRNRKFLELFFWFLLAALLLATGTYQVNLIFNIPTAYDPQQLFKGLLFLTAGFFALIAAIAKALRAWKSWEIVAAGGLEYKPFWYSLYIGFGYTIFGGVYILFSTQIAHAFAENAHFLKNIELIKGYLFVAVTGILICIFTYFFCKKIVYNARTVLLQKEAIAEASHRATTGVFAASIAHDAGNILACLRFCLELLRRNLGKSTDSKDVLSNMANAINELSVLNKRLAQTGQQSLIIEKFYRNIVDDVRNALSLAKANARTRNCQISLEGDSVICSYFNPNLINDMLLNLILNAADATNGTGKIIVYIYNIQGEIFIEIHDDGPGIPAEQRQNIFETFFTTKKTGSGLGLLTVKTCVELHFGSVRADSSPLLGGAVFVIKLPILMDNTSH